MLDMSEFTYRVIFFTHLIHFMYFHRMQVKIWRTDIIFSRYFSLLTLNAAFLYQWLCFISLSICFKTKAILSIIYFGTFIEVISRQQLMSYSFNSALCVCLCLHPIGGSIRDNFFLMYFCQFTSILHMRL